MWNWNKVKDIGRVAQKWLLIEPMWNWNNSWAKRTLRQRELLIEPMWNWNYIQIRVNGERIYF